MGTRIEFQTMDGTWTCASTPGMALVHWLSRREPHIPTPPDLPPLTIHIAGPPRPGPGHPHFLSIVFAAAEREFGGGPDLPILPPDDPQYEAVLWGFLYWLHVAGDVKRLEVRDDDLPPIFMDELYGR